MESEYCGQVQLACTPAIHYSKMFVQLLNW